MGKRKNGKRKKGAGRIPNSKPNQGFKKRGNKCYRELVDETIMDVQQGGKGNNEGGTTRAVNIRYLIKLTTGILQWIRLSIGKW